MFRLLVICACLAVPVLSSPGGAPRTICSNNLTPGHHVPAQNTTVPYTFQGAKGVRAGEHLTVTLKALDAGFCGFAVQAQDANSKPIGQFKVVESTKSQPLDCGGKADTLTHKLLEPAIKSIEFMWMPPAGYKGKVRLVGTVCKTWDVFWVGKVLQEVDVA